jgi:KipI family sensor histidine kinase inhibitor
VRNSSPPLRRAGDRGILIEPTDEAELARVRASLESGLPAGVADWIVGASTILLTLDREVDLATVSRALQAREVAGTVAASAAPESVLEVPVRYDGADLDELSAHLGMSRDELIQRHSTTEWVCQFIGFAPGFGYLRSVGGAPFQVPRRAQARTAVPAGAVALADGYSAIYPRVSPGGWQLIGTTTLTVWDAVRQPPNLVASGRRVRFVPVTS